MHQERIEIIEVAALFEEARPELAKLAVAGEEALADAAEQSHEGELDLRVGEVQRRVDQSDDPSAARQDVAAPQIPVDQGRPRVAADPPRQTVAQRLDPR